MHVNDTTYAAGVCSLRQRGTRQYTTRHRVNPVNNNSNDNIVILPDSARLAAGYAGLCVQMRRHGMPIIHGVIIQMKKLSSKAWACKLKHFFGRAIIEQSSLTINQ